MEISEFNIKLKEYINEAKRLEKVKPNKASELWLKIAEFILEFSKQSDINLSFRMKLWNQVNSIIKNIKEKSVSSISTQNQKTSGIENKSIASSLENAEKENDLFNPENLPSVPSSNINSLNIESKPNSNKNLNLNVNIHDNNASSLDSDKNQQSNDDFFGRIIKMENELKQMPELWKEIDAHPYTPDRSIIPSKISLNNDEKPKTKPVIKVEKAEKPLFIESPIKSKDDFIDPYKGTKPIFEIKDPFSLESLKSDEAEHKNNEIFCKFCGEKIAPGITICPKCGAELV